MGYIFFAALGLMLVFEGILPFLSPKKWREMVKAASKMDDSALRIIGLILMVIGASVLVVAHYGFS